MDWKDRKNLERQNYHSSHNGIKKDVRDNAKTDESKDRFDKPEHVLDCKNKNDGFKKNLNGKCNPHGPGIGNNGHVNEEIDKDMEPENEFDRFDGDGMDEAAINEVRRTINEQKNGIGMGDGMHVLSFFAA